MKELKTLEDIDNDKTYDKGNGIVSVERLKAEAIKWIKNEREYHNAFSIARAGVLIEFFNITEEDLKGDEE